MIGSMQISTFRRPKIDIVKRHGGRLPVLIKAQQDNVKKGIGLLEWSGKVAPQGLLVAGMNN